MKRIAIITARSGSKGLKDKNIKVLCGKPLMAYSILAAVNSRIFERVIVSTDSQKYGEIASSFGAEVVYRDENLSDDSATAYMVIRDVISKIPADYDYFMLLQPTSPLRKEHHILEAATLFEQNFDAFDFLASVKEAEHISALVKPVGENGSLEYFDADYSAYRRQEKHEYSPNGAIFIGKPDEYIKQGHFFGARSLAFFMDKKDSVDIDDSIDFAVAEAIIGKGL